MTPDQLAILHQQCFTTQPRPWGRDEFAELLQSPINFLIAHDGGFLVGRTIADEAELLTIAVAPHKRRRGLAQHMLTEFAATARKKGAESAFLEVASNNTAALALYKAAAWEQVGRRRDYYAPEIDALTLRQILIDAS